MDQAMPYLPEDGDIVAHTFDAKRPTVHFTVDKAYGVGKPRYHVHLEEEGGERSWWLDPDPAETLGRRLVEYGADCRRRNAEADSSASG
jgi:hypothetical protein